MTSCKQLQYGQRALVVLSHSTSNWKLACGQYAHLQPVERMTCLAIKMYRSDLQQLTTC